VALANEGNAPAVFKRVDARGVPYVAVIAASSLGSFAYLSLGKTTAEAFAWLVNLSAVAGLVSWCVLCFGYLRLLEGMRAQGFSRDDLPYKAPFQPYLAWFALVACLLTLTFSGFVVFLPGNFSIGEFLTHYANAFIFIALYLTWKKVTKVPSIHPSHIKLRHEFDTIRLETTEQAAGGEYILVPENED